MSPRTIKNVPASIVAHKHADSRVNIPTEELRDFVSDDEKAPKIMLYPRDPSLDPQLVWKGKDEQDRHPLEVPVVPIYIQEKIHPQAIVESIRAETRKETEAQVDLFADFNGINRHAYFTGAEDPYEKLKRALRADIDEAAWSAIYSTVSRPFDAPETGKIAVKVINHYGDEVLKTFSL